MLTIWTTITSEAQFGTALLDNATFAKEAVVGVTEIGIGALLLAAGVWFLRDGAKRVVSAWRKYQGG